MRPRRPARAAFLVLAVAACAAVGWGSWRERVSRRLLTALEAEEARALCAEGGYSLPDFLARAKAMGVPAAVLRPRPLRELLRGREVLRFSQEEIGKWKAVGLIAPGVSLRPDTLWTKDRDALDEIIGAASFERIAVASYTYAGYGVVSFSAPIQEDVWRGYDLDLAKLVAGSGLLALHFPPEGRKAEEFEPPWRELAPAQWHAASGLGALWRALYSRTDRLILFRLDPARGIEGNFERLRLALREIDRRGLAAPGVSGAAVPPPMEIARGLAAPGVSGAGGLLSLETAAPGGGRAVAAMALAWALGLLGPLIAARAGLSALKNTRGLVRENWPVASPVLQIAGGVLIAAGAAALIGLAARLSWGAAGFSSPPPAWRLWSMAGPMAIAVLTLYTIDVSEWSRRLAWPVTYGDLLHALGILAALGLILEPRPSLEWLGLLGRSEKLLDSAEALWWLPWRWREGLLGFPGLILAFFLIDWRLECPERDALPESRWGDPRGYFLIGLLAPAGILCAFASRALPRDVALEQTAWVLLGGALGGVLLLAVFSQANGPKGPD